jgi:hypothetical protein
MWEARYGFHLFNNINKKKQIFESWFWFLDIVLIIQVVMPEVSLIYPAALTEFYPFR